MPLSKPKKLWRTTVVIWTDYNPTGVELTNLALEATNGDGFCSQQTTEVVTDPKQFPDTEFFGVES